MPEKSPEERRRVKRRRAVGLLALLLGAVVGSDFSVQEVEQLGSLAVQLVAGPSA